MVLVNYCQSYGNFCKYNFCSGKHQHIEQKTKSIPNLNGYLLLALANFFEKPAFSRKLKSLLSTEGKYYVQLHALCFISNVYKQRFLGLV